MLFELISKLFDLLLFVRVLLDVILLFENSLELIQFIAVLADCGLQSLHLFEHFRVNLLDWLIGINWLSLLLGDIVSRRAVFLDLFILFNIVVDVLLPPGRL